jgi:acetyltransferase-like isoleucine patch superfamily enzyme
VNIGATVIDRIHIGDNSVVGASALVTRDLPDNVVAFGTPANIVRDNHWKISMASASNYMNSLLSRFKINQS